MGDLWGSAGELMPVLFVGHGSPMNAIEDNEFTRGFRREALALPKPRAILCVSAHWETHGSLVTSMKKPSTIHDFYGFPRDLCDVEYPAPGSKWLAEEVVKTVSNQAVRLSEEWGLDHGCWAVFRRMYPEADVLVVQLSLDREKSHRDHYELAKQLAPLGGEGVLIIGSGNMVHNLGLAEPRGEDFNAEFGFDWAIEANDILKRLIGEGNHDLLIEYLKLGRAVQLVVPTNEHYLLMLYALALRGEDEPITYFNDKPVAGSLTMTSFRIG